MGAYLSQPVTDKETFVGAKTGFLEFGGSSMQVICAQQGRRRSRGSQLLTHK